MFSHVLVAYQAALLDFATKSSYTFQAALKILDEKPQYSFTILKDLTQGPVVHDNPSGGGGEGGGDSGNSESKEIASLDFDQMLFFKVQITHQKIPFSWHSLVIFCVCVRVCVCTYILTFLLFFVLFIFMYLICL